MNYQLISNLNALMDYHKVPESLQTRALYLAENSELPLNEIKMFLKGKNGLSKGSLKKLADLFEVDVTWLARGS